MIFLAGSSAKSVVFQIIAGGPLLHGRGFLRFAEEGKLIFGGFYLEGMRLLRFPFRNFSNASMIGQPEAGNATSDKDSRPLFRTLF